MTVLDDTYAAQPLEPVQAAPALMGRRAMTGSVPTVDHPPPPASDSPSEDAIVAKFVRVRVR
jgi:hypothetical protein